MLNHPATPYVAPMVVFFVFLAAGDFLGLGQWEHPFRCAVLGAAIWFFSRHVIDWKPRNWLGSILIGLAVIAIWVAPDALWPGYRMHWLFNNQFFKPSSSLPAGYTESTMVLIFRTIRAVVLVPIIEELFWRGWLIRWLINPDFEKVALGAYQFGAFVIASLLFASEHGSYWEVGLICGLIYNWWMVRTKSLADLTLTHAVSNAALSAYVIIGGHWEYWL